MPFPLVCFRQVLFVGILVPPAPSPQRLRSRHIQVAGGKACARAMTAGAKPVQPRKGGKALPYHPELPTHTAKYKPQNTQLQPKNTIDSCSIYVYQHQTFTVYMYRTISTIYLQFIYFAFHSSHRSSLRSVSGAPPSHRLNNHGPTDRPKIQSCPKDLGKNMSQA